MTARGVLLVLCGVPSALQAQVPTLDARIGVGIHSADRTVYAASGAGRVRSSLMGAELLARGDGFGIVLRWQQGSFEHPIAGGAFRQADGAVTIGAPPFHLMAGYGRRARGTSIVRDFVGFGRVGARTALALGGSGIGVEAGASALLGTDPGPSRNLRSVGREAEVALLYQMPRGLPLFVTLGYRYQWFKNTERAGTTREELSVLILGAGVRQVRLQVPKG